MTQLTVIRTGALVTVQDLGRSGLAHLGVPIAGPVDSRSHDAVNRAVGNDRRAAALEILLGGFVARADGDCVVAIGGAQCPVTVDGEPVDPSRPVRVHDGQRLEIGTASAGTYACLAVRGGFAVEAILGSRSTDTLCGLGPQVVTPGAVLPVGASANAPVMGRLASIRIDSDRAFGILPGPHLGLVPGGTMSGLTSRTWTVSSASDRTAIRLDGAPLTSECAGIASEGLVPGAIQLPPDGQPIVFLANHPVTGGYPVIAVVPREDLPDLAQRGPGSQVRFS